MLAIAGWPGELATLRDQLQSLGWAVVAANAADALQRIQSTQPRLIVASFLSPSEDLWHLIPRLKERTTAPLLGLFDLERSHEICRGLQAGVDEYVCRPFRAGEMDSRLRILLWRSMSTSEQSGTGKAAPQAPRAARGARGDRGAAARPRQSPALPFRIDDDAKLLVLGDRRLPLTRKEYEVLKLLSSKPGQVFSVEQIIQHVWPDNKPATATDVHQRISLVRKKIEKNPRRPEIIQTVRGFGYRLAVQAPALPR